MSDHLKEYFESQEANEDSKRCQSSSTYRNSCGDGRCILGLRSVSYSDKNLSASRAAIQPKPAEVIACLYI